MNPQEPKRSPKDLLRLMKIKTQLQLDPDNVPEADIDFMLSIIQDEVVRALSMVELGLERFGAIPPHIQDVYLNSLEGQLMDEEMSRIKARVIVYLRSQYDELTKKPYNPGAKS